MKWHKPDVKGVSTEYDTCIEKLKSSEAKGD